MVAQRQDLEISRPYVCVPNSLKETQQYAEYLASSSVCPQTLRGRPADVFIVIQTGAELGMHPMQALRTLGVINGMPFAYGDGFLALIKAHPDFEDMKEWFEGSIEEETLTAFCSIKRKNQTEVHQSYSIKDAMRAGLWNKKHKTGGDSTWSLHGKRMLQWRARSYAGRDAFPDALFGVKPEIEVKQMIEATIINQPKQNGKGIQGLEEALGVNDNIIEGEIISDNEAQPVTKLDELKELIDRQKITKAKITVMLKKSGVESLEDLTDELIDKWTTHLKTKESK